MYNSRVDKKENTEFIYWKGNKREDGQEQIRQGTRKYAVQPSIGRLSEESLQTADAG